MYLLKGAARTGKFLAMVLLVNNASTRRHPLNVPFRYQASLAGGIVVLHLALKGDRDGFKASVCVCVCCTCVCEGTVSGGKVARLCETIVLD
jgi:hypothetical protein